MADIVQKVAAGLVAFPILFGATLACCPRQLSALQPKRRAWVLTLWSSAYLTLSAAPFVVDFLRCGGDVPAYMALVRGSPVRSLAAEWMCAVFLAFCVEDTVVGHLLGTINLLTGYIHHGVYSLVILYTFASEQAAVFALFAFLELPTFILALSTVCPSARNDRVFAGVFGATRIALHAWMLSKFAVESCTDGAVVGKGVVMLVSLALALHIHWFSQNIKGMLARHRLASALPSPFPTPLTSATVPTTAAGSGAHPSPSVFLSPSASSAAGSDDGDLLATPHDGAQRASWDRKAAHGIPEIVI